MIEVSLGVIQNERQQFLMSKRLAGSSYAGYWEFPGGKLEHEETPLMALTRELKEEIDIAVKEAKYLDALIYEYPSHSVKLHVFDLLDYFGNPKASEGQTLAWYDLNELKHLDQILPTTHSILNLVL